MGLLDRFRRQPAQLEDERPSAPSTRRLTTEQAVERLSETLLAIPDPDETLFRLGIQRHALRRLLTDDEIDGALEVRREAVLATSWRLDGDNEEQVQWLTDELAPHMPDLVRAAWSAIPFGYSVVEAIYRDAGDGRFGIERYSEKPMEWFEVRRSGELRYYSLHAGRTPLDQHYKFLVTRNQPTYRNPYGEALLSRLYWPWLFRRSGWEFWVQFLERFGQPLLLGQGADPDKLADALARAARDSVIAVGGQDEVSIHQASGEGMAFERAELALVRRIQRRILGQTLTTGTDQSGSRALGEVHERVAETKRNADLRLVTDTAQRAVNALSWLNWPDAEPPTVRFGDEHGIDAERAERDQTLYQAGARFTPEYFRRAYGFADDEVTVEEGDAQVGAALSAEPQSLTLEHRPDPGGCCGGTRLQHDGTQPFTDGIQSLEDLADDVLRAVDSPIPPETLRAEIEAAEDVEDLQARLAALAPSDQDDGEFHDMIERALFAAYILGYEAQERQLDLDDE